MASNSKNIAELLNGDTTVTATDLSYPLTGFSSTGIDDNATSTAITISSDEEVLLGKTTDAQQTAGTTLYQSGQIYSTAAGSHPLVLTRKTNDGALSLFYKDTTEVGSIKTDNGKLVVNSQGSNLVFAVGGTNKANMDGTQFYPQTDGGLNLSHPSVRWQNLYLTGGVYLGGTGSANKLDDYEVGTWSPTLESAPGGISIASSVHNKYVKVGNIVHLQCYIGLNTSSSSTAALMINNLPFTPLTNQATSGSMIVRYGSSNTYAPYISGARIEFYRVDNTGNWHIMNYSNVGQFHAHIGITYQT